MADPTEAKWWPKFDAGACSVCGAVVGTRKTDQGQHQLWHGMLWRLIAGDPRPINEVEMLALREWLREADRG